MTVSFLEDAVILRVPVKCMLHAFRAVCLRLQNGMVNDNQSV